ncbi:MAG: RDD family protein [Aeromicrobium sp.]
MTTTLATSQQRRSALFHDALLFCGAFTAGAIAFTVVHAVVDLVGDGTNGGRGYWEIGLSDGLILSGLIVGELFILWNNGVRQGIRGHSIGKHRTGLRVVDVATEKPTGPLRGLARGVIMAALLDLAVAAIPIGLPTVFRRLTPESWHFGGAAYIALLVLAVPFLISSKRGFADLMVRTRVIKATGEDAVLAEGRRHILEMLDILGVIGVVAVAANYVLFYWPFLFHFPKIF